MEALQKLLSQIASRLRDITLSQRVALVLGGALVAVSLIWLIQWAATPEMVPLLDQDMQPEDIATVRAGLEAMGEPFDVRGSQVFVRAAANRQALLAQLQQKESLPANTSIAFANLVQQSNPWISQDENRRRWTYALQEELKQVLRQMQGVKSAAVFLNLGTQKRGFSRVEPASSASVTLVMRTGERVPRSLAMAAARLVAGAVSGLPVQNVQVVDANGRLAIDWNMEDDAATLLDRKRAQEEQRYAEKVRSQVPDPNALVGVQVELDTTSLNERTEQALKGVTVTEESTRESTVRARRSNQPGVQPNVGVAAGSGGPTEEAHEKETTRADYQPGLSTKVQEKPAGEIKQVTAAISLSRSYLANVFKSMNPDIEEPNEADIEEAFQRERARLMSQVVLLVKPQEEENVNVTYYYDTAAAPVQAGPSGAVDEALDLMQDYGPQSGLALLALVALGLMFRMSRKSDSGESFGLELGLPEEAIEAARMAASDMSFAAGRAAAGRAAAAAGAAGVAGGGSGRADVDFATPVDQAGADGMLVAQEVDADTVQSRKMLDQIADVVEADPESVAALVEQWMQRSDQYHDEGI